MSLKLIFDCLDDQSKGDFIKKSLGICDASPLKNILEIKQLESFGEDSVKRKTLLSDGGSRPSILNFI